MRNFFLSKKLSRKILLSMGMRLSAIVSISCLLSYCHLMNHLEARAEDNLEKYSAVRGQREEIVFANAEKNHKVLIDEFLYRMERTSAKDIEKRFDQLVLKYPDGHFRNRKTGGPRDTGIYIQKSAELTIEFKKKIVVAYDLVSEFGPPMHAQFQDTYFTFPEKAIVLYWPEAHTWVYDVKSDYHIENEEWFQLGPLQASKSNQTAWTGTFFDTVGKTWMVTAATPVQRDGKFLASVHHDILLDEIFDRTIKNSLKGTFNYLVREDGRLIAHPDYQSKIESTQGKYYVSADRNLQSEFNEIIHSKKERGVLNLKDQADALVGYSYIRGPGWYLVSFYPKSVLRKAASSTLSFTVLMGILSLIVELFIVFFVLRNEVTRPLDQLVSATKKLSKGEFQVDLNTERNDELGDFARTFVTMKDAIQDRDRTLAKHNKDLEGLVFERTRELEQERLQKIQASKMAALGEMAGGIAHEINTPLAAIQMRANQIQELSDMKMPEYEFFSECAQAIDRTVERVAKIIRGLRNFSRDGSQSPIEAVLIKDMIQDTLDLASEKLKNRGIELRVVVDSNLSVDCRAIQISQVLLNLLNNACDALENQKEKWIRVQASLGSNDEIQISVTDSGPGIPAAIAEKIMQPFFTTKDVGKGTGLGLSISRSIALEHRGDLILDTQAVHTRFILILPSSRIEQEAA